MNSIPVHDSHLSGGVEECNVRCAQGVQLKHSRVRLSPVAKPLYEVVDKQHRLRDRGGRKKRKNASGMRIETD